MRAKKAHSVLGGIRRNYVDEKYLKNIKKRNNGYLHKQIVYIFCGLGKSITEIS